MCSAKCDDHVAPTLSPCETAPKLGRLEFLPEHSRRVIADLTPQGLCTLDRAGGNTLRDSTGALFDVDRLAIMTTVRRQAANGRSTTSLLAGRSGSKVMKVLLGIACLLLIECTPRAPTVAIRDVRTRAPAVAIRAVTVVDVMDGSLRGKQTASPACGTCTSTR